MDTLDDDDLRAIRGGADPGYKPDDNALGRVGPGKSWRWLGDYYTPEALAHDQAVRGGLAAGEGQVRAHLDALPKLPAAIGSYVRARLRPGPDDRHIPAK